MQLVLGMRPRDRGLPWDAERVGMAALVAVAITFGVHSAVDWTWFIPATALCGLLAAGFVAARPPLRTRMEAAALDLSVPVAVRARPADPAPLWAPPAEEVPAIADIAGPGALAVADAAWHRRAPFPWWPAAAAVMVVVLALAASWAAIQPVRSVNAGDAAIERLQTGNLEAAVDIANIAHDRNPLAPDPLWELAYIEQQRGRLADAQNAPGGGGPDPARERRDLAPARPLPALGAQPARRRARVVPGGVLPRPAQPRLAVGLPRGEPRERAARHAAAG